MFYLRQPQLHLLCERLVHVGRDCLYHLRRFQGLLDHDNRKNFEQLQNLLFHRRRGRPCEPLWGSVRPEHLRLIDVVESFGVLWADDVRPSRDGAKIGLDWIMPLSVESLPNNNFRTAFKVVLGHLATVGCLEVVLGAY